MNKLLTCTALLLALATPALAQIGGDSITGNSGIANNGTIQNSTLNNGTVAGGAFSPTSSATGGTAIAAGGSATAVAAPVAVSEGGKGGNAVATTGPITFPKNPKQAPAVLAPGLVAGFDCLGSNTGGISTPLGSATIGGTTANEDCINVYLSRELERKGDKDGSWGVLCESDKVRKHSSKCPVLDEDVEASKGSEYLPVHQASPAKH